MDVSKTNKTILIWVCPKSDCTNYYGASSDEAQNLGEQFTGPGVEDTKDFKTKSGSPYRHSRAECPDCRAHGEKIERMPIQITVSVPTVGPSTPALPTSYRG